MRSLDEKRPKDKEAFLASSIHKLDEISSHAVTRIWILEHNCIINESKIEKKTKNPMQNNVYGYID